MSTIPLWMSLLMTQQHLQQESAAPGFPAVPPRFQSGPQLASEGGSWHQRGVGFPSLKGPQTAQVTLDMHLKTVLLKSPRFFCTRSLVGGVGSISVSQGYRKHSPNTCTSTYMHNRWKGVTGTFVKTQQILRKPLKKKNIFKATCEGNRLNRNYDLWVKDCSTFLYRNQSFNAYNDYRKIGTHSSAEELFDSLLQTRCLWTCPCTEKPSAPLTWSYPCGELGSPMPHQTTNGSKVQRNNHGTPLTLQKLHKKTRTR